ncbi:MAG: radical SAM family heme chaperone HemW [Candidatus Omnitrophica bacterium]|nr:radical SAM family heme chaperone HemW [Candidatus Omnitrophota bacterium]
MNPGLYVHVPFCARRCHYCNFLTRGNPTSEDIRDYLNALRLHAAAMRLRTDGRVFGTLYLGGGTPAFLDERSLAEMFAILRENFVFLDDAEITCEANPGELDSQKIQALKALAVKRVSLGIQSFDDALLQKIGRSHDAGDSRRTIGALREAGFVNVSADLMIRLPGQSVDAVRRAARECARLSLQQVVIYDLNVHNGTVFGRLAKDGRLDLPSEDTHQLMMEEAEAVLEAEGFRRYEISNFARPGFESRHNLIYWNNGEYLGLGPGAFSYLDGDRFVFAGSLAEYFQKCASGDWRPRESETIGGPMKEMETLLTGLRLSRGVCRSAFVLIRDHLEKVLPPLVREGFIEEQNRNLRLTRKGRYAAETVFTELSFGD